MLAVDQSNPTSVVAINMWRNRLIAILLAESLNATNVSNSRKTQRLAALKQASRALWK